MIRARVQVEVETFNPILAVGGEPETHPPHLDPATHQRAKEKAKARTHDETKEIPITTQHSDKPNTAKETCGYCGGNHVARNCWKRQNDEKKDGVGCLNKAPHKQANMNLQIDDANVMFSQSVLSVVTPDSSHFPALTQWGENEEEKKNEETLSNETLASAPASEAQQATEQENQSKKESENALAEHNSLPVGLETGLPKPKESPQTSDSASVD